MQTKILGERPTVGQWLPEMAQRKKAKDRESVRLEPDAKKLLQAALDKTGADKSLIFNEALRINAPAVVDALIKARQERDAQTDAAVRQIREKKDKA